MALPGELHRPGVELPEFDMVAALDPVIVGGAD